MSIKKLLGEKIKRLRKSRGLTQEEFAEMIDIAPRNLSRIEVGESFVSADTLDNILLALNITADILFSYEHIRSEKDILADIYTYLDRIKTDKEQLERVYKLLRLLADDEF